MRGAVAWRLAFRDCVGGEPNTAEKAEPGQKGVAPPLHPFFLDTRPEDQIPEGRRSKGQAGHERREEEADLLRAKEDNQHRASQLPASRRQRACQAKARGLRGFKIHAYINGKAPGLPRVEREPALQQPLLRRRLRR